MTPAALRKILTADNRVSFLAMLQENFCEHASKGAVTVVLRHNRQVIVYGNGQEVHRTNHRNIEPARKHFDALVATFNLA